MLAQASMRAMGKYELGWLQALVTQDAPHQAPRLAFAPQRDDDEGTEAGIFIGPCLSCSFLTYSAPKNDASPLHVHSWLDAMLSGSASW